MRIGLYLLWGLTAYSCLAQPGGLSAKLTLAGGTSISLVDFRIVPQMYDQYMPSKDEQIPGGDVEGLKTSSLETIQRCMSAHPCLAVFKKGYFQFVNLMDADKIRYRNLGDPSPEIALTMADGSEVGGALAPSGQYFLAGQLGLQGNVESFGVKQVWKVESIEELLAIGCGERGVCKVVSRGGASRTISDVQFSKRPYRSNWSESYGKAPLSLYSWTAETWMSIPLDSIELIDLKVRFQSKDGKPEERGKCKAAQVAITPRGKDREPAYWSTYTKDLEPDNAIFGSMVKQFNAGVAGVTPNGLGVLIPFYRDGCAQAQRLIERVEIGAL